MPNMRRTARSSFASTSAWGMSSRSLKRLASGSSGTAGATAALPPEPVEVPWPPAPAAPASERSSGFSGLAPPCPAALPMPSEGSPALPETPPLPAPCGASEGLLPSSSEALHAPRQRRNARGDSTRGSSKLEDGDMQLRLWKRYQPLLPPCANPVKTPPKRRCAIPSHTANLSNISVTLEQRADATPHVRRPKNV